VLLGVALTLANEAGAFDNFLPNGW
jgi:hypothetical protein